MRLRHVLLAPAVAVGLVVPAAATPAWAGPPEVYSGTFAQTGVTVVVEDTTEPVLRLSFTASYVIGGPLPGTSTSQLDCLRVADEWRCHGKGSSVGQDGSELDNRQIITCNADFTECTGRIVASGTGADGRPLVVHTDTSLSAGVFRYQSRVITGTVAPV